jgi:hypothetical protein
MHLPPQHIIDKIAACERLGDPTRNSNPHEAKLARDKAIQLRNKWKYIHTAPSSTDDDTINSFHEVYKRYQRARSGNRKRTEVPETTFVAGFRYYDGPKVIHRMRRGDNLTLLRRPENIHDGNALAVLWKRKMIGYIPRRKNNTLSRLMDKGHQFEASIYAVNDDAEPWEAVEIAIHRVGVPKHPSIEKIIDSHPNKNKRMLTFKGVAEARHEPSDCTHG